MPSRHVIRFQVMAPTSAAATTIWPSSPAGVVAIPEAMVFATAVPVSAPTKFAVADMRIAWLGAERPGRHRRRDGVRRVVEAVDVVEADGQDEDGDQEQAKAVGHGRRLAARRAPRLNARVASSAPSLTHVEVRSLLCSLAPSPSANPRALHVPAQAEPGHCD